MARIPKTTFLMGSPVKSNRTPTYRAAEKPQHVVTVNDFCLGKYLVTAEQYCIFLNSTPNKGYLLKSTGQYDYSTITMIDGQYVPRIGAERCPATPVTWYGAVAYCVWLSRELGYEFRLPTEAEWECAAWGAELRPWPWGSEDSITLRTCKSAQASPTPFYNFRGLCWMYVPWEKQRPWIKSPVGSFPLGATPDGVYDMLGYYTGQWCFDPYNEKDYLEQPFRPNNTSQEPGLPRVVRGMYHVPVDGKSWRKSGLDLFRVLNSGDAKWPQHTSGRTWSRMSKHPSESWALFRVASDS